MQGFRLAMVALAVTLTRAQRQPQITAAGVNLAIVADQGDVTLQMSDGTCLASELCGMVDRLSTAESQIASLARRAIAAEANVTALGSDVSALRAELQARPTTQDMIDLQSTMTALVTTAVAGLAPLVKTMTIGQGQPQSYVLLGDMSIDDVLTIDLAISECSVGEGASITLLNRQTSDDFGSEAVVTDFSSDQVNMTAAGLRGSDRLSMFSGIVGGRVRVYAALQRGVCDTAVTAHLSIKSAKGDFDRTSVGPAWTDSLARTFTPVALRVVGHMAENIATQVESMSACARRGQILNTISGECEASRSIQIGNVVITTTTVLALSNTVDRNQTVVLAVPSPVGYPGIVGKVEYWCERSDYGAGQGEESTSGGAGSASFSVVSGGTAPVTSLHSLNQAVTGDDTDLHLDSKLRWATAALDASNDIYAAGTPKLLFMAQHGIDCVVKVSRWNASQTTEYGMYLPVGNPSFERPVLANGRTAPMQAVPLWRLGGDGGGVCGIWRPPAGNSDYHDPFDGVQVLFCNNVGCVHQDTGVAVENDKSYALSFWTYMRGDHPFNGWSAKICAGPCDGGGSVIATDSVDEFVATPPHDTAMFATISGSSPGYDGRTLNIEICGTHPTASQGVLGQSNYDQVVLRAIPPRD